MMSWAEHKYYILLLCLTFCPYTSTNVTCASVCTKVMLMPFGYFCSWRLGVNNDHYDTLKVCVQLITHMPNELSAAFRNGLDNRVITQKMRKKRCLVKDFGSLVL